MNLTRSSFDFYVNNSTFDCKQALDEGFIMGLNNNEEWGDSSLFLISAKQDEGQMFYFRDITVKNCHRAERGAALQIENGAQVEIFGDETLALDNSALYGGVGYF
mmetsp:Transcript_33866/g.52198  ORF Transcript_33866/g.52198 Transcript_33866/m.52198 type:complete len:105 (+) Transcript_33866:854-1168(+)